jgi:two-component sensor histidine kinase/PAS domain-containing protein
MSDQIPEFHSWMGTDNPFVQIPEDPGVMRLLIVIVATATICVAVFSLTHGIVAVYQYLFLLPIVMTAYFFPRYGIAVSMVMGLLLILLNVMFVGENLPVLSLTFVTFGVFLGIGGIITMLSENITGLKRRYQDIFAMSEAGIVIFNRDSGCITEANPGFLAPLGYESARSGLPAFCELFERAEQYCDLTGAVTTSKRVTDRKCSLRTATGTLRQFQISAREFAGPFILCTLMDITERKQYEDTLRQSLTEKEILLKEVHHRVKNNMQVIMSLLELNALKAENQRERSQYTEMQGRVMTMALIHEKLYQSPISGSIEGEAYFSELLKNVVSASIIPGVTCLVRAPGIFLDIDKAIPCGLIINELATNSLKYAFHEPTGSEIHLFLVADRDGFCVLDYFDNGNGIPDSFDFSASETLGIRLIHMLVRQLKGVITITNHKGTHFCIRFPLSVHERELKTSAAQIVEQTTIAQWA